MKHNYHGNNNYSFSSVWSVFSCGQRLKSQLLFFSFIFFSEATLLLKYTSNSLLIFLKISRKPKTRTHRAVAKKLTPLLGHPYPTMITGVCRHSKRPDVSSRVGIWIRVVTILAAKGYKEAWVKGRGRRRRVVFHPSNSFMPSLRPNPFERIHFWPLYCPFSFLIFAFT